MADMGVYLERRESPSRWDNPLLRPGTFAGSDGRNALTEEDMEKNTSHGGVVASNPHYVSKIDASDADIDPSTKETIENAATDSGKSSEREGRTVTPYFQRAFAIASLIRFQ